MTGRYPRRFLTILSHEVENCSLSGLCEQPFLVSSLAKKASVLTCKLASNYNLGLCCCWVENWWKRQPKWLLYRQCERIVIVTGGSSRLAVLAVCSTGSASSDSCYKGFLVIKRTLVESNSLITVPALELWRGIEWHSENLAQSISFSWGNT